MDPDVLERILSCPSLPTPPEVALRVLEAMEDERATVDELERLIINDQALVANILRTVNSSIYGLSRPCTSVGQALVLLGMAAVKGLVIGCSLAATLPGAGGLDHVAFWRRALYSAVAARRLAQETGRPCADDAFLGALLQDIGVMAMHQALGDRYRAILERTRGDHRRLVRLELMAFEVQHPDIGAMLVRRWRLPDKLAIAIKYHERPTAAPTEHADLARCVGLANLAHDVLTDAEPAPSIYLFHILARQWVGLDAPRCDALFARIADEAREASALFGLDTGPSADAPAIVARAQDAVERLRLAAAVHDPGDSLAGLLIDADGLDALTGALSRAAFIAAAEEALRQAREAGRPLALLSIGIDAFDDLQCAHGVEAADAVLVEAAALLLDRLAPPGAAIGRWDGPEFMALLPGLGRAAALEAAGALRAAIDDASRHWRLTPAFDEPDLGSAIVATGTLAPPDTAIAAPLHTTASIGVATADPADGAALSTIPQLIAAAKRAAAAAAKAGGNRVRAFVPQHRAA